MPPANVFDDDYELQAPRITLPKGLKPNVRLKMDGLKFLAKLPPASIPVAFLDPQYRGVLDKLSYGNEGKSRGRARCALTQMPEETIGRFVRGCAAALTPSGHLFLWMDKFHLCTGFTEWLDGTPLEVVDMLTWDKGKLGMGYRTRRTSEHLVVLQKRPKRAKGVWTTRGIPDVLLEKVPKNDHAHAKPIGIQGEMLAAVSDPGDLVIDPAAGSFSVLEACRVWRRNFLGCDLNG